VRLPFVAAPLWWVGAKCRVEQIPISKFFSKQTAKEARRICRDCPVRYRCLEENLDEQFGVWGGHSRDERFRILSAMDRGATLRSASKIIETKRTGR